MSNTNPKTTARHRRQKSIRKALRGSGSRPRIAVFRSARHIYAQLIDDDAGVTIASASTLSAEVRAEHSNGGNREAAEAVGRLLAQKAIAADIKNVVFDRGGFLYHGRVAALATGARDGGLEF
jgi:large subunit ribosomal protein L18